MDFATHLRNLRTDYLSGKPVKYMQFVSAPQSF